MTLTKALAQSVVNVVKNDPACKHAIKPDPDLDLLAPVATLALRFTNLAGATRNLAMLAMLKGPGDPTFDERICIGISAVTIEAWVTFPNVLPVNCFFYGFGNTDGSGSGEDYIFCAPQGGRIAITAVDPGYTGEQNAAGAGDLSQQGHLHLVAVYDPPAGYLACYTNGVLAALNNSVTVAMSSLDLTGLIRN